MRGNCEGVRIARWMCGGIGIVRGNNKCEEDKDVRGE